MGVLVIGQQSRLREMEKRISHATKKLTPKKGQKLQYALINPVAPMGRSSTVVRLPKEKDPIKIELEDKVFVMPEKWSTVKKVELRKRLILDGWNDCTKCVDSVPQKKKDVPVIYVAGHPENEPDNPKEGEFVVEYKIRKQKHTKKFVLKKGKIETQDKHVFNALLKQNFVDCGRKPVTDEPPPENDTPPAGDDDSDGKVEFD